MDNENAREDFLERVYRAANNSDQPTLTERFVALARKSYASSPSRFNALNEADIIGSINMLLEYQLIPTGCWHEIEEILLWHVAINHNTKRPFLFPVIDWPMVVKAAYQKQGQYTTTYIYDSMEFVCDLSRGEFDISVNDTTGALDGIIAQWQSPTQCYISMMSENELMNARADYAYYILQCEPCETFDQHLIGMRIAKHTEHDKSIVAQRYMRLFQNLELFFGQWFAARRKQLGARPHQANLGGNHGVIDASEDHEYAIAPLSKTEKLLASRQKKTNARSDSMKNH